MQSDWKIIYTYAHCAQLELQNRFFLKIERWLSYALLSAPRTSQWSDENARLDFLKNDKKITEQSVHR